MALFIVLAVLAILFVGLVVFTGTKRWHSGLTDRLAVANGVAGTMLAVVALVISYQQLVADDDSDNPAPTQTHGGGDSEVSIGGGSGGSICIDVEGDCPSGLPPPDELAEAPVADSVALLNQLPGADQPPSSLPASFVVLGTNGQGIYYRDGYTIDANRLPGEPVVRDARPVLADCIVSNEWVADPMAPNTSNAGVWLKVRYPQPGDVSDTYVYGGFTFPVGHNGKLPECPSR
ncbi:hypothetical protein GCM10009795_096890 [Nocardioides hankookensis]|uniref:Uncharacterized protein n=1 Tax=Nocardioides hankookensis TaxID=443157 RepID=A0ABW1LLT7_9ACTN